MAEQMRRAPVQERSTARVGRMLDVCGDLIEEYGYEATTTTMIAKAAGVSVGSLYQFFPDKRAVVQALARRNMEAFFDRLVERLDEPGRTHWWESLELALEVHAELHREVPGFRVVRFGDVVDTHLLEPAQDNDAVFAMRMFALLADRFGYRPDAELQLALVVLLKAMDAVARFAYRDRPGDPRVLAEGRVLMDAYLTHHLRIRGELP